jgi:hypothetical protein
VTQRDGSYEVNLRDFVPGDRLQLVDGRAMEVVENPRDGAWLICREQGSAEGAERVFLADVAGESD